MLNNLLCVLMRYCFLDIYYIIFEYILTPRYYEQKVEVMNDSLDKSVADFEDMKVLCQIVWVNKNSL